MNHAIQQDPVRRVSTRRKGDFNTTIQGIPCQINVVAYSRARSNRWGHIDNWLPDDPEEFEYEVLDRKGYSAAWLQAKITPRDDERIYADFHDNLERNRYDD